jgi:predicted amidohydrolase YtcJ
VSSILLRDVTVGGERLDCLVVDDAIAALSQDPRGADLVIDGDGGALLPGLGDHHLHLFAMAAAAASFDLTGATSYAEMSRVAVDRGGLRVVGWDEQSLGDLDRDRLDALVGAVPVRVQHRSGALWVLSSAAIAELDESGAPDGAERDAAGRLTGRVWRADGWLRVAGRDLPALAEVGRRLASYGVTAVTDATPDLDADAIGALVAAADSGDLPQRLQLLGAPDQFRHPWIRVGPRKVIVADHDLPMPEALAVTIAATHDAGRAVAIHCVSRAALAVVIAALSAAGPTVGDRLEHLAVADPAALDELRELGVVVVTQPSLLARRGDDYLDRHDVREHADLWRYRSLMSAGIPTVPSSDAPYGDPDPWATIRAARDRRTATGRVLGDAERLPAKEALAGLLAPIDSPAAPPRRVVPGAPADLVLLDVALDKALAEPSADHVAATIVRGRLVHCR